MDIIEFFDPYNKDHIKAYREMEQTAWPKGFLPKDIYISEGWDIRIKNKIVNAWINHILGDE
jgi:hypothetical protein